MSQDRKQATRQRWLELLQSHRADFDAAGSEQFWSPARDCASRDELRALQNEKLKVLTPFLYENSDFYRHLFDSLRLTPADIQTVEDLMANPPWGTYTTHNDALWNERGWSLFTTSGTTGLPRVFAIPSSTWNSGAGPTPGHCGRSVPGAVTVFFW